MSSLTNWKFLEMKPMNNNTKNTPINENNNKDKYHIKDQQAAETKSYDSFESIKSEEGFTPLTTNNNKTSSITIKAKSCSTSNKKQQNSLVRNQQEKETNILIDNNNNNNMDDPIDLNHLNEAINSFATNKTFATGLLDIALISTNFQQMKQIICSKKEVFNTICLL